MIGLVTAGNGPCSDSQASDPMLFGQASVLEIRSVQYNRDGLEQRKPYHLLPDPIRMRLKSQALYLSQQSDSSSSTTFKAYESSVRTRPAFSRHKNAAFEVLYGDEQGILLIDRWTVSTSKGEERRRAETPEDPSLLDTAMAHGRSDLSEGRAWSLQHLAPRSLCVCLRSRPT